MSPQSDPGAPFTSPDGLAPAEPVGPAVPMPSGAPSYLTSNRSSPLTPVVCDERAIGRLLELLLSRSGLTVGEAARRMGVTSNTIRQYIAGRRSRPSLIWFVRLAAICDASVSLEWKK
jgi:hypothetical protein